MKIQLDQNEIEEAVRSHITNMGLALPVTEISFTQTRGPTGLQADVELGALKAARPQELPSRTPEAKADEPTADTEDGETAADGDAEEEQPTGNSLFSGAA